MQTLKHIGSYLYSYQWWYSEDPYIILIEYIIYISIFLGKLIE